MIKLNSSKNAILHIADVDSDVKNFIYQRWDEKLTNDEKFDVMIQAVEMQKMGD